uniref:Uncharacterized protein n=1 Tax=Oryza barthii TaxID=65489 RepID=A0A0D3EU84_9ORYZ
MEPEPHRHVDHDDGDDEDEEEEEGNVARFFQELLEKDAGLRGFYEAEREKGRFLCLVCEGIGARAGKRFAGCAALVQHAGSVARAGRRMAHRAFADAVGRLLGWSAGRTRALQTDSDNAGMCDEDIHCEDVPQSAEMGMCPHQ